MKNTLIYLSVLTSVLATNSMAVNKVIYGEDNRVDINLSSKKFLVDSVAAMIPSYYFAVDTEGSIVDTIISSYRSLETYQGYPTCDDTRFRTEPTIANCTGFLISKNLLVTAGHCVVPGGMKIKDQVTKGCRRNKWVFNYDTSQIDSKGNIRVSKKEVYGCKRVVSGSYTGELDYAIIELDKEANDKQSLKINTKLNSTKKGTNVYVAGHPTGLPLKVADGAQIKQSFSFLNQFETDLDTFAGNSGSPVLNEKDEVVGILVAGEIDYAFNYDLGCYEVNVCKGFGKKCQRQSRQSGAIGETVTKITSALSDYKNSRKKKESNLGTSKNN